MIDFRNSRIVQRESTITIREYYNFDLTKVCKQEIIRGAQLVFEGYKYDRLEELYDISVNLHEIEKDKEYHLYLSMMTQYNSEWHLHHCEGLGCYGLILIGIPDRFTYFQEENQLIPNEPVVNFHRGKLGFKLKPKGVFPLQYDEGKFHVTYGVNIFKNEYSNYFF